MQPPVDEGESVRVVDTDDGRTLTRQEIEELKRLASLSRSTRLFIGLVMGIVTLFGIDKIVDFLTHKVLS